MSYIPFFMYKRDGIFRHSLHNHSIFGISVASTNEGSVLKRIKSSYLKLYYTKI